MQLVERRRIWYIISLLAMLPGIVYMIGHMFTAGTPLPLNIDYTGGTLWEVRFEQAVAPAEVRQVFLDADFPSTTVFNVEDDQSVQIKFSNIDIPQKDALEVAMQEAIGPFEEQSFRSIGPSIGSEVSQAALLAIVIASILILLYIAAAFRSVPHPIRYGACALIAMVHDVLIMISGIAIMNLIFGWEIDALFLTAALTVIGYSVNDTIVVFDRVRENLRRYRNEGFATVANRSLVETMQRSVATQVTTLFALVGILVLGGATLRQFMAMLIIGLVSGTYSSLFTATPLLVAWEEGSLLPGKRKQSAASSTEQAAAA